MVSENYCAPFSREVVVEFLLEVGSFDVNGDWSYLAWQAVGIARWRKEWMDQSFQIARAGPFYLRKVQNYRIVRSRMADNQIAHLPRVFLANGSPM